MYGGGKIAFAADSPHASEYISMHFLMLKINLIGLGLLRYVASDRDIGASLFRMDSEKRLSQPFSFISLWKKDPPEHETYARAN